LGFYRLMQHLGTKSVFNHADFRLMDRRTVGELLRYPERNLFMRGIVPLLGFKSATVEYERSERTAGTTKYPLSKMLSFAVDGITSFSIRPVRLVLTMGIVFVFIAIIILAYVLYSKFSGHAVSGWSSMILSMWFIGGCILIGLGIVGEYIGKIYIEVKGRPRYHIETTTGQLPSQKQHTH
ncbi:MAG: glycosyltransferase, partial [Sodaliphilus sp.]|nr:glycosyltransferase [Sodaliphilus sp.]